MRMYCRATGYRADDRSDPKRAVPYCSGCDPPLCSGGFQKYRKACERTKMKYLRFLRDKESVIDVRSDVLVSSATGSGCLPGWTGRRDISDNRKQGASGFHSRCTQDRASVCTGAPVCGGCRFLPGTWPGRKTDLCDAGTVFRGDDRALLQQTKALAGDKRYRHHRRFSGKKCVRRVRLVCVW